MRMEKKLKFEPLRNAKYSSISTTYTNLGPPFAHPVRLLFLSNLTNSYMTASFDGINDHIVIPTSTTFALDIHQDIFLGQGTQIFVKGTYSSPTSGYFHATTGFNG